VYFDEKDTYVGRVTVQQFSQQMITGKVMVQQVGNLKDLIVLKIRNNDKV
jgi:hypothetical protein